MRSPAEISEARGPRILIRIGLKSLLRLFRPRTVSAAFMMRHERELRQALISGIAR